MFIDFDGTLADLAPRPDDVIVAPGLVDVLSALNSELGGALAIVSGRSIAQLDDFLAPLHLACAGVHGAERRNAAGAISRVATPGLSSIMPSLQLLATKHTGLLLEVKPGAVALHYRLAPQCEALVMQAMEAALASSPGMVLMFGKMVIELKPADASKGRAIEAFMAEAPFKGRTPLFAGDDVTDESGFAFVQSRGGLGIKVGPGASIAQHHVDTPTAFRAWLQAAAAASTSVLRTS